MTYDIHHNLQPSASFIGLTIEQARSRGFNVREVLNEYGHCVVTRDYVIGRFNVETRGGVICRVVSIG